MKQSMEASNNRDYSGAIKLATKAIELKPTAAFVYFIRCGAYDSLGAFEKAIADCNSAISIYSGNHNWYIMRASVYIHLNDPAHAVEDATYAIAAKLSKNDMVAAYLHRADAYLLLKDYQMAIKDANSALKLDPNINSTWKALHIPGRVLGDAYRGLGDHAKAVETYENGRKAQQDNPKVYYGLAESYYALGKKELAIYMMKDAIKYAPQFPEMARELKTYKKRLDEMESSPDAN